MKFHFTPSKQLKNQHYVETGNRRINTAIEVDEQTLLPEQRAKLLEVDSLYADVTGTRNPARLTRRIGTMSVDKLGSVIHAELDAVPTPDEAVDMYLSLFDALPKVAEQKKAFRLAEAQRREEMKARTEAFMAEYAAEKERKEAQRAAELEAKIAAASLIDWKDGKVVIDLLDTLFIISGDEQDDRFNNWAKVVTGVEQKTDNGYDFVGRFVNRGTVEIEPKRTVYLVASTNGSRKYNTTTYRIILLDPNSGFVRTDISTDNSTPGWALRIRDQVKELLES